MGHSFSKGDEKQGKALCAFGPLHTEAASQAGQMPEVTANSPLGQFCSSKPQIRGKLPQSQIPWRKETLGFGTAG